MSVFLVAQVDSARMYDRIGIHPFIYSFIFSFITSVGLSMPQRKRPGTYRWFVDDDDSYLLVVVVVVAAKFPQPPGSCVRGA